MADQNTKNETSTPNTEARSTPRAERTTSYDELDRWTDDGYRGRVEWTDDGPRYA